MHPSIILAAFQLCASATAVALDTRATSKTLVAPASFDELFHYANFVFASSKVPCKKPPNGVAVEAYININSTDTQTTVFRDDARKEFIVTIPGTASGVDIFTDAAIIPVPYALFTNISCPDCAVHVGFLNAALSVIPSINTVLKTGLAKHPTYTVAIAGYSLGGALANLVFSSLTSFNNYTITGTYTYGEPRVGNVSYANFIDKLSGATSTKAGNYHRVTHQNDIVPQLPPTSLGYQHSRTEYWELNATTNGYPTANTTYRCYGQEAADCNDGSGNFSAVAHGTYAGFQSKYSSCS